MDRLFISLIGGGAAAVLLYVLQASDEHMRINPAHPPHEVQRQKFRALASMDDPDRRDRGVRYPDLPAHIGQEMPPPPDEFDRMRRSPMPPVRPPPRVIPPPPSQTGE